MNKEKWWNKYPFLSKLHSKNVEIMLSLIHLVADSLIGKTSLMRPKGRRLFKRIKIDVRFPIVVYVEIVYNTRKGKVINN